MVVLAKVLGCSIPDLYRRRDTGNVIISDIFVMKRTEMLAQTLAMESGDLSKLIFNAGDQLDEAHTTTLRAIEDLTNAERQQERAIDLLAHAGRAEVVDGSPDA